MNFYTRICLLGLAVLTTTSAFAQSTGASVGLKGTIKKSENSSILLTGNFGMLNDRPIFRVTGVAGDQKNLDEGFLLVEGTKDVLMHSYLGGIGSRIKEDKHLIIDLKALAGVQGKTKEFQKSLDKSEDIDLSSRDDKFCVGLGSNLVISPIAKTNLKNLIEISWSGSVLGSIGGDAEAARASALMNGTSPSSTQVPSGDVFHTQKSNKAGTFYDSSVLSKIKDLSFMSLRSQLGLKVDVNGLLKTKKVPFFRVDYVSEIYAGPFAKMASSTAQNGSVYERVGGKKKNNYVNVTLGLNLN